jgi:hypothetical protein
MDPASNIKPPELLKKFVAEGHYGISPVSIQASARIPKAPTT